MYISSKKESDTFMNNNNSIAVKIAVAFLATAILICGAFGIGASTTEASAGTIDGSIIVQSAQMEMEEYQSKGMSGGDKYRKWLTGRADGASWCATWVSYVLVTRVGLSESSFHKTGSCQEMYDDFRNGKSLGQIHDKKYVPSPGDIIFFDYKNEGETHHVGIVTEADNTSIRYISGNSGSRPGTCRKSSIATGSSKIYGFATLSYSQQSGVTLAGGAKNAENVYYTLLANGWTKQSASGVIGNLLWETGGANSKNPTNISGDINPADKSATRHAGKFAYGIVQWDEGESPDRTSKMFQYCASRGRDWTDLESQVSYMLNEMATFSKVKKNGGIQKWKSMTSPEESAKFDADNYEICAQKLRPKRQITARAWYEAYKDK